MGVAVPRELVDGTPQTFGHGSYFDRKLLSRKQVSQKNQAGPHPLSDNSLRTSVFSSH